MVILEEDAAEGKNNLRNLKNAVRLWNIRPQKFAFFSCYTETGGANSAGSKNHPIG